MIVTVGQSTDWKLYVLWPSGQNLATWAIQGGQQVEVRIDQNNPTAWNNSPTSNWQWTPAVVTHCSDTPPSVTCIVASRPYLTLPTFTNSWQITKTFNIVNVRAIDADKGS
eukprot:15362772-Ditylum_brightwellii.AAC.1